MFGLEQVDLNHLHLNVSDPQRSLEFYCEYFGFEHYLTTPPASGTRKVVFIKNAHDFTLGLESDPGKAPLPDWFHLGFRLSSPEAVKSLYDEMVADKIQVDDELETHDDYVSFVCFDPDGHHLEIFWDEAPASRNPKAQHCP